MYLVRALGLLALVWLLAAGVPVLADTAAREAPPRDAATHDAITHHELAAGGQHIAYTATAGTLPLTGPKGEVTANIFYTAYEVEPVNRPRPVTFVFNGGPGAASAFLHIAAIGPRVVPFNDQGSAVLQPVRLIDNPDSWLAFTDLVFVDPAETGFSRATGGEGDAKDKFFGTDKDADAFQELIRLYLTRHGRSLDPVFLTGESYGGFRAAVLAKRLLAAGYDVRGAVLVSPALEFSLLWGDTLTLLPIALALPSIAFSHDEMAATHEDQDHLRKDTEAFARGRYLTHMAAGLADDPEIDADLARFTGLPLEQIAHSHGRVSVSEFLEAYRRETDRGLSRYDGSVSVPVQRPSGDQIADPVLDYTISVLGPAFESYARSELNYTTDLPYLLLNRAVSGQWDYGTRPNRQGYAGALDDLQEARTQRPWLHVMIAGGLTDLVTPYAGSAYLIDQMKPIEGAVPVELHVYRGGHMMYLRPPSRAALTADARRLYADALR